MTDGIFHFLHLIFWEMTAYFGELGSDFLEKVLKINEKFAGLQFAHYYCPLLGINTSYSYRKLSVLSLHKVRRKRTRGKA